MAFPNDGCAICVNSDSDPRNVDGKKGPAGLAGKRAAGLEGLSIPTVKAEDSIGLGDGVPTLEIGQRATIGFAGSDMTVIGVATYARSCFAEKPIILSSHSTQVRGWKGRRQRFPRPV